MRRAIWIGAGLLVGLAVLGVSAQALQQSDVSVLSDGMKGFKGQVIGSIVKKGEAEFVLKIEKVTRIWDQSTATNPQSGVGTSIVVNIDRNQRLGEELLKILAGLKTGDRVEVEAFNLAGSEFKAMELLKKVEAAPAAESADVLRKQVVELKMRVAAQENENQELRMRMADLDARLKVVAADLRAELDSLRAENAKLREENAKLRQQLAEK